MAKKIESKVSFIEKDINGEKIEITTEAAGQAVKDYYVSTVEKFINDFLEGVNDEVEGKLVAMQSELTLIIEKKIDSMAEKIVAEVLNHRIKEQLNDKVDEKLKKATSN